MRSDAGWEMRVAVIFMVDIRSAKVLEGFKFEYGTGRKAVEDDASSSIHF